MQLLGGLDADAPQPPHRKRMQEGQLAVGWNQQQAVGLGLLAGDLGQELGAGDADRDRQSDAVADLRAQRERRSPPECRRPAAVPRRRGTPRPRYSGSTTGVVSWKTSNTASLACRVRRHPRRHDDGVRAQRPRLTAAHRGAHTVGLGLVACCQYDAAADDHRPAAQRGVVTLFDRRVERVEVSVQDGGFRRPRRHEHMFASRSD